MYLGITFKNTNQRGVSFFHLKFLLYYSAECVQYYYWTIGQKNEFKITDLLHKPQFP